MEGKDFWNGALESPYCNIKFLKSFLSFMTIPLSSESSLSNQLAAKNNSVIEVTLDELLIKFDPDGVVELPDKKI